MARDLQINALVLLACAGVAVSALANGPISLTVWLLVLVLGATSGAADVGANAVAGGAEQTTGRPMLTRAHGAFSAAVVLSSVVTGGLQLAGLPVALAFGAVVVAVIFAAGALWAVPSALGAPARDRTEPWTGRARLGRLVPLVVVGLVGALAFAVENAHQSWGAVFLAGSTAGHRRGDRRGTGCLCRGCRPHPLRCGSRAPPAGRTGPHRRFGDRSGRLLDILILRRLQQARDLTLVTILPRQQS